MRNILKVGAKFQNGWLILNNIELFHLNTKLRLELDPKFRSVEKMDPGSSYGVIHINDFYEHFYMSSSRWSIADYLRQWDMAY